jgi:citrate lyase subunit beta/citryl-CoA lyase
VSLAVERARSLLYVPATRPDRVAKARASSADVVIVDLEDAVPSERKTEARIGAAQALAEAGSSPGAPVWVRINSTDVAADLGAVVRPGLDGVVVPKAEPELLAMVDAVLGATPLPVVALIETAVGVLHAEEVARSPRVARLAVGEADLVGELRLVTDADRTELAGVRLQIVLASAAAGLVAPIGPVERCLDSDVALARTTTTLLRQGFRGRTALHPRQLGIINATFRPTDEEIRRARAAVSAFEAAGCGTLVTDGEFIDRAVIRGAYEVLARAD